MRLAVGVAFHQRELPRAAQHHLGAAHRRPSRFGEPGPAVRADPDDDDDNAHRTLPSNRSTAISSTTRSGCGCGTR